MYNALLIFIGMGLTIAIECIGIVVLSIIQVRKRRDKNNE